MTKISFLGQSNAQILRLNSMNVNISDLQRQLSTQKKYEDFVGFGADRTNIQRYRMDLSRLQGYMSNIGIATARVNQMSDSLTRSSEIGRQLIGGIQAQAGGGDLDIALIQDQAEQNLIFLRDLANSKDGDRYLFSGSATTTEPLSDLEVAKSFMQGQIDDWMDGTQTTAQMLANITNATPVMLGFDPTLSTAGPVAVRLDQSLELDYTSIADENGLQTMTKALALGGALRALAPGDTPTSDEMQDVLDYLRDLTQDGVNEIDDRNGELANKFNLINTIEDNHRQDIGLFQTLVAERENADTAEVVTKIQALQTQLQASYQVTSLVSQLSLINFL